MRCRVGRGSGRGTVERLQHACVRRTLSLSLPQAANLPQRRFSSFVRRPRPLLVRGQQPWYVSIPPRSQFFYLLLAIIAHYGIRSWTLIVKLPFLYEVIVEVIAPLSLPQNTYSQAEESHASVAEGNNMFWFDLIWLCCCHNNRSFL